MKVSPSSRELLREVSAQRQPRLAHLVDQPTEPSLDDLSVIIDNAVGSELAETGFGQNDEPNPRGRALEDLIDELNRIRLRLQGTSQA